MRKFFKITLFLIILFIIVKACFGYWYDESIKADKHRWGYIDKNGKTIISSQFDLADPFSEGLALVYLVDPDGKPISGAKIINKEGKIVIDPPSDIEILRPFTYGMAMVKNSHDPHYIKAGFINASSTIAIPLIFKNADDFTADGLAKVALQDDTTGYIDRTGKVIFSGDYMDAGPFSEGLAGVCLRSTRRCGYVNTRGALVIPAKFHSSEPFSEGLGAIIDDYATSSRVYSIDHQGKKIIEFDGHYLDFQYGNKGNFKNGRALISSYDEKAQKDEKRVKYGFIDTKGTLIIPAKFIDAEPFSEGLALVTTVSSTEIVDGYIDTTGTLLFTISHDYSGEPFAGGLARVYSGDKKKYGYIDSKGSLVIPFQFESANDFSEGLAAVQFDPPGWALPMLALRDWFYNLKALPYAR